MGNQTQRGSVCCVPVGAGILAANARRCTLARPLPRNDTTRVIPLRLLFLVLGGAGVIRPEQERRASVIGPRRVVGPHALRRVRAQCQPHSACCVTSARPPCSPAHRGGHEEHGQQLLQHGGRNGWAANPIVKALPPSSMVLRLALLCAALAAVAHSTSSTRMFNSSGRGEGGDTEYSAENPFLFWLDYPGSPLYDKNQPLW